MGFPDLLKCCKISKQKSKELSTSTIETLKATAPVVQNYGTKITESMYSILLNRYPEVKNFFNMSHFRKNGDNLSIAPQVRSVGEIWLVYVILFS